MHARGVHAYETPAHQMHAREIHVHEASPRQGELDILARNGIPVRYTPMRYTPFRCTPGRCTPVRYAHEMHVCEVHAHEIRAREMHARRIYAYEGFCEDLARQNTVVYRFQLQLSTYLSVFNLSIYYLFIYHSSVDLIGCQSDCLRFFSLPHLPLINSLDSELWYHFRYRVTALASVISRPLGSLFGSFHHAERALRVINNLTAESPTIRSFKTSLVSI
jgi:hypothetical protein